MTKVTIQKISITRLNVDAIVNAANTGLRQGGGVCGCIFREAGAAEMTEACSKYGHCDEGSAVITPGFRLSAGYVIHTVGPVWRGGNDNEPSVLYSAYKSSLELAKEHNLHSIAFPLVSAGIFGYPVDKAWNVAIKACKNFDIANPNYDIDVIFAVLDDNIIAVGLNELKANGYAVEEEKPFVKATPDQRVVVFRDTMAWIESDDYLKKSVEYAKAHSEVFYEDNYPVFDASKVVDTKITVSMDRSYQAAMRIHKEEAVGKIAVMNFANAFRAGGGVERGAGAQEECLCRTSTLYPVIYNERGFYQHHSDLNTSKASDSLIYSEGIVICKTDEELPVRMPEADWVTVDVITVAAPDLRHKSNRYAPLINNGSYMNDAELFGYHVKRAIHVFTVAAAKGADTLILGAFGCGAFENNPEVVARAYKIALQQFPQVFKRIEFAVYCPPWNTKNYEVFKRAFE